jgi:hypothetical protein
MRTRGVAVASRRDSALPGKSVEVVACAVRPQQLTKIRDPAMEIGKDTAAARSGKLEVEGKVKKARRKVLSSSELRWPPIQSWKKNVDSLEHCNSSSLRLKEAQSSHCLPQVRKTIGSETCEL